MARPLAAILLAATLVLPALARGQDEYPEDTGFMLAGARAMHAATAPHGAGEPDTVWVGHSYADHWSATRNWWNVYTGVNRPGSPDASNAVWDWDHWTGLVNHGIGDSLAGWWPVRRAYTLTGGMTLPDGSRPWWALDYGNVSNYVMNAGPGGKRTKGVVGVWHADAGVNQPGGSGVTWTPLSGTRSAWCGLRQLNDHSVKDAITGNPYNQSTMDFAGPRGFPGYASQWDQMLYRDIAAPAGQPLTLTFLYRTRMSTQADNASATRTGWFHGDPLAVTTGNFISSTGAGVRAPADSFQVYAGVPVNEASCTYSDGRVRPVYDPQRRWFSEVLRIFEGPSVPYFELFAKAGCVPADTNAATPSSGVLALTAAQVDAIRNAPGNAGGCVRLVFRVKTNRGFDDSDGTFTSATRGAVLLDDVTVNGEVIGDFEQPEQDGENAIDNRLGASPLYHWKSTGKPPAIYFHLESVANGSVTYNDLCGPWDSPARRCDLAGTVATAGNHDDAERHGDSRFAAEHEVQSGMWSPVIDLVVDESGANQPNPQGITAAIKNATGGYYVRYDVYAGMFNLQFTGNTWNYGVQVYPVRQPVNGANAWGAPVFSGPFFLPEPLCLWDVQPLSAVAADTPSGLPDSLRVYLGTSSQCFNFAISLGCNSADGAYFDNVSLAFVDPAEPLLAEGASAIEPGRVVVQPWFWFNDAFPANETATLPNSANFDTTAALIKTGLNIAPATGNAQRFDVPADTVVIRAADVRGSTDPVCGNGTRVDMVFRILPGPGNYRSNAPRTYPPTASMPLLRVPSDPATVASAGDGSFWGTYLAEAAAPPASGWFGEGTHHGGAYWDHLTWNSARCDTAERNAFPVADRLDPGPVAGSYMTMLHEEDPKFATLGVPKFRCFVVDTALPAEQLNVRCDGTVPAWLGAVPGARTGWDGTVATKEYTKIIPDGLLTPGSHVQYFFRKSPLADPAVFAMSPDTNFVIQRDAEGGGSWDGHRWQQFGVLPDRWKHPAFGGSGMACILYVDLADRWGSERVYVSLQDSIGGTSAAKRGAHNGWSAPSVLGASDATLADPANFVRRNNQQPGTTWDLYGVKASESLSATAGTLGNRLANRASLGLLTGKEAKSGPTPEMLRKFYRHVYLQSGGLTSGVLGPYVNRSQNDIALLNDYLTGNDVGSTPQPRGLQVGGNGFAQSETWTGGIDASHLAFLRTKLGITLRNASYQSVSGNTNDCADLITTNVITTNGDVYGVGNRCEYSTDLLQRNPAVPEAVEATYYENFGVNGPYVASVYKGANGTRNWVSAIEGWDPAQLFGRQCVTSGGRLAYYFNANNNLFGSVCAIGPGALSTLDVPQSPGSAAFTRYLKVGDSVLRGAGTTIRFGVTGPERVRVRLYDVAGRAVRTLADRTFAPGEYVLPWDGADDQGRPAPRGVYFARLEYAANGTSLGGRVVILR